MLEYQQYQATLEVKMRSINITEISYVTGAKLSPEHDVAVASNAEKFASGFKVIQAAVGIVWGTNKLCGRPPIAAIEDVIYPTTIVISGVLSLANL